jgi:hypothetical protein
VATAPSCASYTVVPDADRARIEQAHAGELVWLSQSVYVGAFYDDDRFRLVHPRRFEELTYLKDAEGLPIVPPSTREVIPAGTRVRIERIEWPTGEAVFRRPLYTPRYATWVYLRVCRDRGECTFERDHRHILLAPGGTDDAAAFEQWLQTALTTQDPNPWLASLPVEQLHAIEQKRALPGMDEKALYASLGFADHLDRKVIDVDTAKKTFDVVTWGPTSVVLENGVVQRVMQDGKLVDGPAAKPVAPVTPATPPATAPPAPAPEAPVTTSPPAATTTPAPAPATSSAPAP